MFQKIRLMREKWPNAQMLSEELFAMFSDDIPLSQDAPLTITPPAGQPGLILNQGNSDTGPVIKIQKGGTTVGGVAIQNGQPVVTDKNGKPTTAAAGSALNPAALTPAQLAALQDALQATFLGIIVSGTGASYQMKLYKKGKNVGPFLDAGGTERLFTVNVADIDAGETIPAGRWFLVAQLGTSFWLQAPVWEMST